MLYLRRHGRIGLLKQASDLARYALAPKPFTPPRVLLACMPKSGSTYLAALVASLPGVTERRLDPLTGCREQELCTVPIARAGHGPFVAQHHIKLSEWTTDIMRTHCITPVILRRNFYDIVPSLRDWVRAGNVSPVVRFESRAEDFDQNMLDLYLARVAIPWYITFHLSWKPCGNAINVRYEEVVSDPASALDRIIVATGAKASAADIENAILRARTMPTRRNVGRSGRGETLSSEVREAIRSAVACCPGAKEDVFLREMLDAA